MENRIELTAVDLRIIADYLDDPEDLTSMDIAGGYFTVEEVVRIINDELLSFVLADLNEGKNE